MAEIKNYLTWHSSFYRRRKNLHETPWHSHCLPRYLLEQETSQGNVESQKQQRYYWQSWKVNCITSWTPTKMNSLNLEKYLKTATWWRKKANWKNIWRNKESLEEKRGNKKTKSGVIGNKKKEIILGERQFLQPVLFMVL